MHAHDLTPFSHAHAFEAAGTAARERAMARVTWLTLAAMAIELAAGWWSGSLALLADGWHMGTHALALGGAALAYRLARRASARGGVGFGGWKIEVLAAYTSGLALALVSVSLVVDAVQRLLQPQPVAYLEAMGVAVFGLAVNLLSAWWLAGAGGHAHAADDDGHAHRHTQPHGHAHGDAHAHAHGHAHPHADAHDRSAPHRPSPHGHDHNFSAAYMHVLADALTSLLAIAALAGGLWFGWGWLDAAAALLGAALIARWSWGVLRVSAASLVDAAGHPGLAQRVRDAIESDGDAKLADLHVWQVGGAAWAAEMCIVADRPLAPDDYRGRLAALPGLAHVTIEVNRCRGDAPMP